MCCIYFSGMYRVFLLSTYRRYYESFLVPLAKSSRLRNNANKDAVVLYIDAAATLSSLASLRSILV